MPSPHQLGPARRIGLLCLSTLLGPTAGAGDAIVLGAYHFDAWDSDSRVWVDGAPSGELSIWAGERAAICGATQDWFDSHPIAEISVPAASCSCAPADCNVSFIHDLAQRQFLFEIGPIPPDWSPQQRHAYCDALSATEPRFNYWTRVRQAGAFKRERGAELGWPDDLVVHAPLSVARGYLGFYDDADVAAATRQIQTAADWGVDFFVFELHFNLVGEQLKSSSLATLDAFNRSPARNRVRFAVMWLNEAWDPIGGAQRYDDDALDRYVDFLASQYLHRSNYLRDEGRPVLYLWRSDELVEARGSLLGARDAVERVRSRLRDQHGFAGLYLVAVDPSVQAGADYAAMGVDAVTQYNASAWAVDQTYAASLDAVVSRWDAYRQRLAGQALYQPAVHTDVTDFVWAAGSVIYQGAAALNACGMTPPGQDLPARLDATGPSPENFGRLLAQARDFLRAGPPAQRAVAVNAWNEWGEGGIIQPTEAYGYGHLMQIREVFGVDGVSDGGLEEGDLGAWATWNSGPADLALASCPRDGRCAGLRVGRLHSSDQPFQFAYQSLAPPRFEPGRPYTAWARLKTSQVVGDGARLRVDFRGEGDAILRVDESPPQAGSSADFELHVISGRSVPLGTRRALVQICGSTDRGSGAGAQIDFDEVRFKASLGPDSGPCRVHAECGSGCCRAGACDPTPGACRIDAGAQDAGRADADLPDQATPDTAGQDAPAPDRAGSDGAQPDARQPDAGARDAAPQDTTAVDTRSDGATGGDLAAPDSGESDLAAGDRGTMEVDAGGPGAQAPGRAAGEASSEGGCACAAATDAAPPWLPWAATALWLVRRRARGRARRRP